MAELSFDHPDSRRKRQDSLDREHAHMMSWFANSRPAPSQPNTLPMAAGTIYFVGPENGPIKIGYASRLEFRLKDLRTMNAFPLIVHATVQGPAKLEREYHRRFAAHRSHGEWFERHPDILAEITRLQSKGELS